MDEPEIVRERDWDALRIGDYVRVTCGQGRGRPKLVLTGVIDDKGYSDDLLDAMEEDEEGDLPFDVLYLHTMEDNGTVICQELDLAILSLKRAKIERHPDFGMSAQQLDAMLTGGH